jgi:hypothetical protein
MNLNLSFKNIEIFFNIYCICYFYKFKTNCLYISKWCFLQMIIFSFDEENCLIIFFKANIFSSTILSKQPFSDN